MREGLMTGARIERASSSGTRPGVELRPHMVVTVKFEGLVRDGPTGKLSLRDPKLAVIRSDRGRNASARPKAVDNNVQWALVQALSSIRTA